MSKIFQVLAFFSVGMLAAALVAGLTIGDLQPGASEATLRWATIHRLFGIAAALTVVFANSIVVTYFIGTTRWCREVVETYALDPELVARSARIKRRAFPWAVGGMLLAVGIVALGGAADPGSRPTGTERWIMPHLVGALLGVAAIAWAFWSQAQYIAANHQVIEEIMAHVRRIRAERGLEVS